MVQLTCWVMLCIVVKISAFSDSNCDRWLSNKHFNSLSGWNVHDQCQLHTYQPNDVVQCFDMISAETQKKFHLTFLGDSRTRQQFISLTKLFPDYDLHWSGFSSNQWSIHEDVFVDSDLLNVRISFKWRPIFDESVRHQLEQWVSDDQSPNVIILGVGSHHMLPANGRDHKLYEKRLTDLVPYIKALSTKSRVIWLHQNPVLSVYHGEFTADYSFYITPHLMEHYNQVAHRVFRDSGALIWDSGVSLAEEYSRGCRLINRQHVDKYHRCTDFIHIGYVAIDRTTQIFLNFLCNKSLAKS